MKNEIKCDSIWAFKNDSSNHAHDGANGHEGVPEMLQRQAKENYGPSPLKKDFAEILDKDISKKLLSGEL